MFNLPSDLIEEILSRIPTRALCRWLSTCKRWNSLFKDQRFTKKHFDKAPEQFMVLMLDQHKVFPLSLNLHGIENNIAAPFIEFKGELGLKDSHSSSSSGQVDICCVFHCGGLLLCTTTNRRLVVWNPCTGETRCIKSSNRYYKYSMFSLGYENNKSGRSYKILRYRSNHHTDQQVVEFEIYDFSSGSWRFLEITAKFLIVSRGVSLKGNTYWLTSDDYLLSFDFSTERLRRLRLPFKKFSHCATASLSVVRDEKLSMLRQYYTSKMEIWVTTNDKIDQTTVLSWGKFLAIDLSKWPISHKFSSCSSFFIDEEKRLVVCCDGGGQTLTDYNINNMVCVIGECGVYREFQFGEREITKKYGTAKIYNYAPSLVQIQQG